MAKKRVLLTGSAGGIGQMFLDFARERYDFVCFDRKPTPGVGDAIKAELTDLAALEKAAEGCDAVLHLAAKPNHHPDYAGVMVPWNLTGTWNAYEAAARAGVKRFIFASTVQTEFGHGEETKVSVDMPAKPENYYAAGKVFGEHVGFLYSRDRGLSVIAIRFGGVVTPGRREHMVGGDGYVDPITLTENDACELIQAALDAEGVGYAVVPGYSLNARAVKDLSPLEKVLGWQPREDAAVVYGTPPARDEPEPAVIRETLEAAEKGDVGGLAALISRDPRLANAGGPGLHWEGRGIRPLHYTARTGNVDVARFLLERGADPNVRGGWGQRSPLDMAAARRNGELAELMIAHGGKADVFVASALGDAKRLRTILEKDPGQANARRRRSLPPLFVAGNTEAAAVLLEYGADLEAGGRMRRGEPPLVWTLERSDVAALLAERMGKSGFFVDCLKGDREAIIRHLDADPGLANAVTEQDSPLGPGKRALHVAVGREGIIRLLLERGADPNAYSSSGMTPLHMAASRGCLGAIRALAEGGAILDSPDAEHEATPHQWAHYTGNDEAAELLAGLEGAREGAPQATSSAGDPMKRPVRKVLVTGPETAAGKAFLAAAAGKFETAPFPGGGKELADATALDQAAAGCDAFVHLVEAPKGAGYHDGLLADEVLGTWYALEAARRAGAARFVYASTTAVFKGWPEGTAITDSTPLRPGDLHAAVKALGENLCLAHRRRSRLAIVCLRLAPGEDATPLIMRALESPPTGFSTLPE